MILIKGNVERIAVTEAQAVRLKAEGFRELDDAGQTAVEQKIQSTAAKAANTNGMTVKQLRELAEKKGLAGSSSLSREELLEVLKDVI